jgi:exonuclease SbcC
MENTMKCLDALVETARQEQPDIILIAGDIWHVAKTWSDRSNIELRVAADYIDKLKGTAPVVILYGTPNHDSQEMFNSLIRICGDRNCCFFDTPDIAIIYTASGPIQVAALPGFDKGHFRAQFPGLSAEEENQVFTQQLSTIIQGLSAQVDPSIPSVLMAHHTVVGCELDNGQHVFQANEVVLPASALDNSSFDLVCLGHIHKAQRVEICNKPVYYAGSIDAFTFNDEGHEKGFWVHNIEHIKEGFESDFINTPAREFSTIKVVADNTGLFDQAIVDFKKCIENDVVRILYTCDEATEKALDKKKLERDLYAAGAYYVAEIRPEKIEVSVNRERLHEKLTVKDSLCRYLLEKEIKSPESDHIFIEALPIIEKIEASTPAGGQTGLFMPVEISVHNYRSYADETLNFRDISFAMVNGRNGSGKSSLFMDAIVDCLYEQPREGDLTGWIRSGEKSGSISFTFQLGNETYRVTRTRQRSGKGTLALARAMYGVMPENENENRLYHARWEDISCQKLVDTQEKIQQLLGMDADTFRSCVLIMQDQYGRFMEAKPEDRMSVLASLLGLGIYEQLEDETKKLLTEVNRELKQDKDEVSALEEEVAQIHDLETEQISRKTELQKTEAALNLLRKQKDEAAVRMATIDQARHEKERLLEEAAKKDIEAQEKTVKFEELTKNAAATKDFLSREDELNLKHIALQGVKEKLAAAEGKLKLHADKKSLSGKLAMELSTLEAEKSKLEGNIKTIQDRLNEYDALIAKEKRLAGAEEELQVHEQKNHRHISLTAQIATAKNKLDLFDQDTTNRLKLLKQAQEAYRQKTKLLDQAGCIDIGNAECAFLKDAKQAVGEIAQLDVEIESFLSATKIQRADLLEQCNALQKELEELDYSKEQHDEIKAKAEKYRQIKQQLAQLEGDKKLLTLHHGRLMEVEAQIILKTTDKQHIDEEIQQLQQEIADYDNLKKSELELSSFEEQWKQLPAARTYLDTILPQIEGLQREIEKLTFESQATKEKAAELGLQVQDGQKYIDEAYRLQDEIRNLEDTLSGLNRQLGSLEEKLAVLNEKQLSLERKMDLIRQLSARTARLQVLVEAFGQDGIPHQIIRDIIPELEASANQILSQMTGGRMRLEFRTERTLKSNKGKEIATLDIVIIDVDHGELPYLSRSGGQKVRAALAVSFALAMVKASRVGLQLGMMFVDEPPFLDDEGVEAYCNALETIHEKYPEMRILAISHDVGMKARFPQQLIVVSGEDGSKVVRG